MLIHGRESVECEGLDWSLGGGCGEESGPHRFDHPLKSTLYMHMLAILKMLEVKNAIQGSQEGRSPSH